jgi:hypothetical protein
MLGEQAKIGTNRSFEWDVRSEGADKKRKLSSAKTKAFPLFYDA